MRIHLIGEAEIQGLDVNRIVLEFEKTIVHYQKNGKLQLMSFGVGCYDDDQRALFDIPEVRTWAKVLIEKIPFILSVIDVDTMRWFVPCVADIEIIRHSNIHTGWRICPEAVQIFVEQTFEARHKLFGYLASSQEEFDCLCDDHYARFTTIISG